MVFEVKPLPSKSYMFKQSAYADVPGLPAAILITAPSFSGKGVLLQNMLVKIYDGCFSAGIHVWSQSINLDDKIWGSVRKYMEAQGWPPEKYFHEGVDPALLQQIMDEQASVIRYQKHKGHKTLFGQCHVIDDCLDDKKLMRYSRQLEILFTRGRHMGITTIVSNQRYRACMPSARISATDDILFANIRNAMDKRAWFEEQSALVPEEIMEEIYQAARKIPYAFIWVKKKASTDDLVHINFDKAIKLE